MTDRCTAAFPDSPFARLAEVRRSGRIESEHFGIAIVSRADGSIVKSIGDPSHRTYLRSAAKPFQAVTCVILGAADRYFWTDEDLAVVCASHSASSAHLLRVRSILQSCELTADDLRCGPHPPLDVAVRDALIRADRAPERIHNNCSGKHAGMLAACCAMGWETSAYLNLEHPLQQRNIDTMAAFADVDRSEIQTGVDGCGVPTFFLSLRSLSAAYARLADPNVLPDRFQMAASRVRQAMQRQPFLVAGPGRFTVDLTRESHGRVFLKSGAEGLICFAVCGHGVGGVVKISDGSSRAHAAIVCRLLAEMLPDLDWLRITANVCPPIRNTLGDVVGELHASF